MLSRIVEMLRGWHEKLRLNWCMFVDENKVVQV
jgi:hypothetical protein